MKSRKLIAKSNLKKSIYLGGGMAAFTAAVGLAVSIPVYNKIQEELAKTTSKLKDLSSMMSQLTDKLGIPEGASFQKELAGGYEVVYENGETKIYKNNGEGKSLIINMNGDGTVGSAAQMQGPAAQTMLGVIQNAKASMEDDQDAMSDIIGPFANQAEDTSLATESAITGESVATLAKRNQLSAGDNQDAIDAANKRLAALQARNDAIDAKALEDAKNRAEELKAAAEKAKEAADKLAAAKKAGDEKALQDLKDAQGNTSAAEVSSFVNYLDADNPSQKTLDDIQAKIDEDNKAKTTPTTTTAADSADEAYDAPMSLDDYQIIIFADMLKGWAKTIGTTAPESTDGPDASREFVKKIHDFINDKLKVVTTNEEKNNLKAELQTLKINAAQERLDAIKAEVAAAVEKAKIAATQRTTDHQMDHAASAGHVTPAIVKLARSLPNAINALMAAKYGYIKQVPGADGKMVDTYKKPSTSVEKLIRQAMTDQGVSASTQKAIDDKIIAPLFEASKRRVDGHDVQGTISFSEVVNTFALKESSISRLLVLKASFTTGSKATNDLLDHSQLFLANQTTKSPIDFESEGDVLQTVKTDITYDKDNNPIYSNSIYTAANYLVEAVNREINPSITRDAAVALKDVVSKGVNGALKGIKDPAAFNQLVAVAKAIDPTNKPIQEKALVEILLSLAKKYLFEGKDVKVDGQQLIKLIENSFKYDGTKEPTLTLDATAQDTQIAYGPLTAKIIEQINKEDFTDYSGLTKGGTDLVGFVSEIPSKFNIAEVIQLMDDPDIGADLDNLKSLYKEPEGKDIIKNNWELAEEIIHRTDVKSALDIIKEPLFKDLTSSIEDIKKIFDEKNGNLANVYKNLKNIVTDMSSEWVVDHKDLILSNLINTNVQTMILDKNKDLFMSDDSLRSKILSADDIHTFLSRFSDLVDIWGYANIKDISPEEKAFRDLMIHKNILEDEIQDPLKTGDISSDDIHAAFKVLAARGYLDSDANKIDDKVKIFDIFAKASTTTKESVLSIIASLDKYSTGHKEINDGKYIEYIIDRILEDEAFAPYYIDYAISHIDATSALLEAGKADEHYDISFAFDMKDFILEKLNVDKEVIKSIKDLSEYIDQFEDKDGTPEPEIIEFKDNLYKHLYDGSASAEIDKVTKYIKHMIDRSNTGRLPNADYNSLPDKEGTMRQIKMYGDKFFGTNTPIAKTEGDSAQSSLAQVIALEAKAGTPAAKARLALISKFPTIADAWQSGIVDAKPIVDPAYADQADQAIPTKIKSIGYNPEKNTFYMIGTLNGAASIAIPSGADLDKDHSRHKKDGSKIIYDQNKPYSLFVFEAKLVEKDGVFTLQYHRVQSMDFVIETDYDKGRSKSKTAGFTWESDHPMSTASVSTFNSEDNSFIAYGSGGSYANGHSKIWFDGTNWQHKYVDWGKGTYTSVGGAIAGSPSTAGTVVNGHSIGDSWHIGMSTIVDHKLYATEDERSNWYEIAENGATNSLMFSSVPTGYYKINPANDKQRLNIPKPNMIASIVNPIDESTGVAQSGTKLAVFINSFGSKQLMSLDLVRHSMSDIQLWETDSTGHLVKSTQSFDGSQAITTTTSGNIYISAGHPVTPAKPEVAHKDAVPEVKDADGKVTTKGSAEVAHKDAEAEKPGTQQIYRVYLSDGKWQIEKVGNVIEGLRQPITSIYHYTQGKVDEKGNKVLDEHGKQVQEQFIVAISLDGVKVIKDIFAQ